MVIDFDKVAEAFANHRASNDVDELRETYSALKARVVPDCLVSQGGKWGEPWRIRSYAIALRQVLLHRSIALFEGSLKSAIDENAYLMILAVRAAFETTAALGYLHNRLNSLAAGNLDAAKVDEDIMTQMLGTKDKFIPKAMEPKQILSMLEYADVSVSRRILGGRAKQHAMLRESYEFLCEFAHPNFHSNKLAFDLDKSSRCIVFRHEKRMQDEAFCTISYLLIAAPLHVELHDAIDEVLPSAP